MSKKGVEYRYTAKADWCDRSIGMQNSLKKKTNLALILMTAILTAVSFILSGVCVGLTAKRFQTASARSAAEFCRLTIDADSARDYMISRKTDSDYDEILKKIQSYTESTDGLVGRISLISYGNTTAVCIFDTGGESLGKKIPYDNYTKNIKAELINNRNSFSVFRGGRVISFSPLRTIDDMPAGYVVAESGTLIPKKYIPLAVGVFLTLAIIGTVMSYLIARYINRNIFNPIETITGRLSGSGVKLKEKSEEFSEIDLLGSAVDSMLDLVNSGRENLSRAIYDANHDGMTQVFNKRCYSSMENSFRELNSICVIYFDVNNLKLMNDTLGHENGDIVIKRSADYIRSFMEEDDCCFRMGGDEFLLIMRGCSFRRIDSVVSKLDSDSPYLLNDEEIKCSISYGYAYAKGVYSYEQLLSEAEEHMYSKKTQIKRILNMPDR